MTPPRNRPEIRRRDEGIFLLTVYAGLGIAMIQQKKVARRARRLRRWLGYGG